MRQLFEATSDSRGENTHTHIYRAFLLLCLWSSWVKLAASVLIKATQRDTTSVVTKPHHFVLQMASDPHRYFLFSPESQTFSPEMKSVELTHFVPLWGQDSEVELSGGVLARTEGLKQTYPSWSWWGDVTASRPGCGLHPWRHQAVSGPVRLEPATNQSVLKVVLTLSFFSGFSFRLFSQSLWEVQFPSRYAQVSCFQALKHHFVLFLFIFRAFCFHYIDVIKFPLPVFMSQNFF